MGGLQVLTCLMMIFVQALYLSAFVLVVSCATASCRDDKGPWQRLSGSSDSNL